MKGSIVVYGVVGLFVCVGSTGVAEDWPQWRGPGRDGVARGAKLPVSWPQRALSPVWQVPVGDGYSAPVVSGGRLYTHAREGEREVVLCLDASSGRPIWRYGYDAPYAMHDAARPHGPGPKATTTVAGSKVYSFGISSILTCLDAQSGNVVWQVDPKKLYDAAPAEYGTAGSPLVDSGLIIVPVGGKRGGAVMAFDQETGKFAWNAVSGEMPSFCSPIAADLAGVRHVLTFTEKHFVGIDETTGKVLWKYPFETSYRQNTVTPVVQGGLVIASGIGKYAFALRVERTGEGVTMTEAWKNRDLRIYLSSPVVVGDCLYGLGAKNSLVCVHIPSGETKWTYSGDFGEYCSIVVAGDRLLVLDTQGQLTAIQADPAMYRELGQSKVSDAPTWSHLALVGSRIYVRDRRQLSCYDLEAVRN